MEALSTPAGGQANKVRTSSGELPGLVIVLLTLAALYYPTFVWMYNAWNETDSNYSHGFWVPLVIAYFVWEKRDIFLAIPRMEDSRGFIWLGLGLFMHLSGLILDINFLSGLSLIPMAWGLILWYAGKYAWRESFWPSIFILFMVPLPYISEEFRAFLQLKSAELSELVFRILGFNVMREGVTMDLGSFKLFVEAPCSGLNTVLSLVFVGSVVAYLAKGAWWRKVTLLMFAPIIAVAANVLRIVIIGLLGEFYGQEVAMGVFHKGSGMIMYAVGLTLFLLLAWALKVKLVSVEGRSQ